MIHLVLSWKFNNLIKKAFTRYDVTSLYTNIPLKETIEIAVDKIFENDRNIKISKDELKILFVFSTSKTHFQFDGAIYDQIDGIAMGSPLAPALANMFMVYHEDKWLQSNEGKKVLQKICR